MQKEGIFYAHKYFQIGTCAIPLAQCDLKKAYFYKGSTPCANSGLCFYKTELLPHGVCNLWFLAYAVVATLFLATLFLWNAYFYSVKHVWAPNRLLGGPRTGPFFEKTWSHIQPSGIYTVYIYIYIYCNWRAGHPGVALFVHLNREIL